MTVGEIASLGGVVVGALIGWWGYRRGKKSDIVSEQSGIATETRAGTQQIIDGLNKFIDQLQEGNDTYKETVRYLESRLDAVLKENAELKLELARLRKRYGENGE